MWPSYKKKYEEIFFFASLKSKESNPLVRGTDPHQNVTDPQHWFVISSLFVDLDEPCRQTAGITGTSLAAR
jgi:hypothetical protein